MKKILLILFVLLICNSVVYGGWFTTERPTPPPTTIGQLGNIFCEDGGNCTIEYLNSTVICLDGMCITEWNATINITGILNGSYVPYTGAVADVDLGNHNLSTDGRIIVSDLFNIHAVGNDVYLEQQGLDNNIYFVLNRSGTNIIPMKLDGSNGDLELPTTGVEAGLSIGDGQELRIYEFNDDIYIKETSSGKDIIFFIDDGGLDIEMMRFNSDVSRIEFPAAISAVASVRLGDDVDLYDGGTNMLRTPDIIYSDSNITSQDRICDSTGCIGGENGTGYVPYVGAITDVDLGNNSLNVGDKLTLPNARYTSEDNITLMQSYFKLGNDTYFYERDTNPGTMVMRSENNNLGFYMNSPKSSTFTFNKGGAYGGTFKFQNEGVLSSEFGLGSAEELLFWNRKQYSIIYFYGTPQNGKTTAMFIQPSLANRMYVHFPAAVAENSPIRIGTTVNLYEGAPNRFDLATGDSLNLVNGNITMNGHLILNETVDLYESSPNVLRLGSGDDLWLGLNDKILLGDNGGIVNAEIYSGFQGDIIMRVLKENDDYYFYGNSTSAGDHLFANFDISHSIANFYSKSRWRASDPSLEFYTERPESSGVATNMMVADIVNTNSTVGTQVGTIGIFGSTGAVTPTGNYMFFSAATGGSYLDNTMRIYPDDHVEFDGDVVMNNLTINDDITIDGDLNVTGVSYLGDVIVDSENITVSNILPWNGNNVTVKSDLIVNDIIISDEGVGNLFFGENAAPVSAAYNVHVGRNAGKYNEYTPGTYGYYDTYIGFGSGQGVSAILPNLGKYNVGLGMWTLRDNNLGHYNMAIGYQALRSNIDGGTNIAIGANAMVLGESGNQNIYLGYNGGRNSEGDYNIGIGSQVGYHKTTGNANILLGYQSGLGVSGNAYEHNIFIGDKSGDSVSTGSDNILIGYQVDLPTPTTDDYLNIGGAITGDLSTGDVAVTNELTVGGATTTNPANVVTYISEDDTEGTPAFVGGTTLAIQNNPLTGSYAYLSIISGQTGRSYLTFGDKDAQGDGWMLYNNNARQFTWATAAANKMTLDSNGQLGVSTTGSSAGVLIGGDVQLWRRFANYLQIPDTVEVGIDLHVTNTAYLNGNVDVGGDLNVTGNIIGGPVDKYTSGVFNGSLYTNGADSTESKSNALFMIMSDTRGTPQFVVQDGGPEQASLMVRSWLVVNQNDTLLNSSQNNICSDWGFDHLDCNTSSTGADFGVTDDIEAQGIIYADEGLRSHTTEHGSYLVVGDRAGLYSGKNGYFVDSTNIFCDTVANNFAEGSTSQWLVISDENSDYNEARADVNTFINSSCIELEHNPGWDSNFGPAKWGMKQGLNMVAQSGGFFEYYVGNDEQSKFKVKINNGTGAHGVYIDDVLGVDNHKAFTIDQDMNGYDGSIAQNIYMHSSAPLIDSSVTMLLMEGDATNMNNSIGTFIDMQVIGRSMGITSEMHGINMPSGLTDLISVGSADTLSSGYYNDINVTYNFTHANSDVTVFENDNDYIYFGNDGNFTSISISLSTDSSTTIAPNYFYCNNANNWEGLGGVTDTTNGFKVSGTIKFINPNNRGKCNKEVDGTPFSDTTNYSYIAVQRTRNNIVTKPIVDLISISGGSDNFILQDDLIKLNGVSSPPETCSGVWAGAIYYDTDINKHCSCDSTNWVEMDNYVTICT